MLPGGEVIYKLRHPACIPLEQNNDDRIRVWINGVLKINQWNGLGAGYADINLNVGEVYNIQVDYMDTHAGGIGMLSWKQPGMPSYSLIPKACYTHLMIWH
ncbi:MAG: hypothetical protein IPJ81_08295 [Chitinophagaceae bacterium]|nr:hypothetical protein [Chitinophagaceae bacterium]